MLQKRAVPWAVYTSPATYNICNCHPTPYLQFNMLSAVQCTSLVSSLLQNRIPCIFLGKKKKEKEETKTTTTTNTPHGNSEERRRNTKDQWKDNQTFIGNQLFECLFPHPWATRCKSLSSTLPYLACSCGSVDMNLHEESSQQLPRFFGRFV